MADGTPEVTRGGTGGGGDTTSSEQDEDETSDNAQLIEQSTQPQDSTESTQDQSGTSDLMERRNTTVQDTSTVTDRSGDGGGDQAPDATTGRFDSATDRGGTETQDRRPRPESKTPSGQSDLIAEFAEEGQETVSEVREGYTEFTESNRQKGQDALDSVFSRRDPRTEPPTRERGQRGQGNGQSQSRSGTTSDPKTTRVEAETERRSGPAGEGRPRPESVASPGRSTVLKDFAEEGAATVSGAREKYNEFTKGNRSKKNTALDDLIGGVGGAFRDYQEFKHETQVEVGTRDPETGEKTVSGAPVFSIPTGDGGYVPVLVGPYSVLGTGAAATGGTTGGASASTGASGAGAGFATGSSVGTGLATGVETGAELATIFGATYAGAAESRPGEVEEARPADEVNEAEPADEIEEARPTDFEEAQPTGSDVFQPEIEVPNTPTRGGDATTLYVSQLGIEKQRKREPGDEDTEIPREDFDIEQPEIEQPGPSVRERLRRDELFYPNREFPTGEGAVVGRNGKSEVQEIQEEAEQPSVTNPDSTLFTIEGFNDLFYKPGPSETPKTGPGTDEDADDVTEQTPDVEQTPDFKTPEFEVPDVEQTPDTEQTPEYEIPNVEQTPEFENPEPPRYGEPPGYGYEYPTTTETPRYPAGTPTTPGLSPTRRPPRVPDSDTDSDDEEERFPLGVASDEELTSFVSPLTGEVIRTGDDSQ